MQQVCHLHIEHVYSYSTCHRDRGIKCRMRLQLGMTGREQELGANYQCCYNKTYYQIPPYSPNFHPHFKLHFLPWISSYSHPRPSSVLQRGFASCTKTGIVVASLFVPLAVVSKAIVQSTSPNLSDRGNTTFHSPRLVVVVYFPKPQLASVALSKVFWPLFIG